MTLRKTFLGVMLISATAGCGYQEYMDKFEDTLSEIDYDEKQDELLQSRAAPSGKGYSIRLPKDVAATPIPEEQLPEGFTAIYRTDGESSRPIRLVIAINQEGTDTYALEMAAFEAFVFDPDRLGQWMGPGAQLDADALEMKDRSVPAGPLLKRRSQKKFLVKEARINQEISDAALPAILARPGASEAKPTGARRRNAKKRGEQDDNARDKPREYVWQIFFIDQRPFGMFAFQVLRSDFSGIAADAIEMSITTATTYPVKSKDAEADEETDEADPAKKSKKAKKSRAPKRRNR